MQLDPSNYRNTIIFRTDDEYNNYIEEMTPEEAIVFAKEIIEIAQSLVKNNPKEEGKTK